MALSKILFSFSLLLLPVAARAMVLPTRSVMEGIPATSNAVYVDTTNVRLGVGTAAPQTTLDVNGGMQVGSGATKSTFTATGGLTLQPGSGGLATPSSRITYGVSAGSASIAGGLTASSGTFTATGNGQASVATSSGIVVAAGSNAGVTAPYFAGKFVGDGSGITNAPGQINGLTIGFVPRANTGTSLTNGNLYETSTGTSVNLPFTVTGQVHISSGFVTTFAASAFTVNQTVLNTAATVTGSTGTFTVQGSTVACWISGNAEAAAAGNGMIAAITVDGSATTIPNTSATVGFNSCTSGASAPFICPIAGGSYREFQVTSGQHTFVLFMWMISSTATWPGSHNAGEFGCREVPSR